MSSTGRRYRTIVVAVVATMALGAGLFAGLGPAPGGASSHREAPMVSMDPTIDITDVYAFESPDAPRTTTIVTNWIPFQEPAGGPNFYLWDDNVLYDINIDNDGDSQADLIYRARFTTRFRNPNTFLYNTGQVTSLDDPDLNIYQTYDLVRKDLDAGTNRLLLDDAIAVPSFVGEASMPNYAGLVAEGTYPQGLGSVGRAFAGQADDSFFLDLRVFDLLYGGDFSEAGDDTLKGFNVSVFAIRASNQHLAKDGDPDANPIIGIWSTALRRSVQVENVDGTTEDRGPFIQVSRLGMPLVNEVVIAVGEKDLFNHTPPSGDGMFLGRVTNPEVPELIELIYGIKAPDLCGDDNAPPRCRDDLVAVFLTGVPGLNQPEGVVPSEQLRLNMSIPPCEPPDCGDHSRLGVIGGDIAGFPNGRRLADDIIDIVLQVAEGELVNDCGKNDDQSCANDLGDGVDENDVPFMDEFPYIALPHAGSAGSPHHPGLR